MLKAGVIGAGHLGSIHLKLLNQSDYFKLIGYFDINKEKNSNFDPRWEKLKELKSK